MKQIIPFLLIFSIAACTINQHANQTNNYVFKVEDTPVSKEEFVYNLNKNNYDHSDSISKKEIDEYLDLFINFKLKVYEAGQTGLDTTSSFIQEFTKYKNQLTDSYLKDDSVINALAQTAYERMKEEVSASHILIRVTDFSNPEDTLRAFQEIQKIYQEALNNNNFNALAVKYSQDPSVRSNKGYLGYFTALQMVYPFEEAAYKTPVGSVSRPFRTRFGYHILKVHDKRSARDEIKVAHIMIRVDENTSPSDSIKARNKIFAIHDSLTMDVDWNYLCRKYSEDMNTNTRGGILTPLSSRTNISGFTNAAFALDNPGDISDPTLSPYGWHIIKLIEKIPLKPYTEMKSELLNKVKQDSRSGISRETLIARLMNENSYRANQNTIDDMYQYADSSLIKGQWDYDTLDPFLNTAIFEIGDKPYLVGNFFDYVRDHQQSTPVSSPKYYMNRLFNEYKEEELIEYEKNHLAEKNFEYRMLVNEYREGILLFDLMNEKVWNKAVVDTAGLTQYFKDNQDNYMWGNRISATTFKTDNPEIILEIRQLLSKPYYYIDTGWIEMSIDEFKELTMVAPIARLDSVYKIANENQDLMIEMSIPKEMDQSLVVKQLLTHKYDTSRFIIKPAVNQIFTARIVSVAKKDIKKLFNDNSIVNLHVNSGLYEKGDDDILDMIDWEPGIHQLSIESDEYLVYVDSLISPVHKELHEIRGTVISDYQNYLEKNWIRELKSKYNVTVNKKVLNDIYREFEIR